jgi:hypothetical protein
MNASPRPPRMPRCLSDSLQRKLNTYALAASAAGVGVLALAPAAEAEIIYTKTHQVIGRQGIYPLDLRNDGVVNFVISESSQSSICGTNELLLSQAYGNAVAVVSGGWPAALKAGIRIGSKQRFRTGRGLVMAVYGCGSEGDCNSDGKWANVNDRYLGLQFKYAGKTHYGWARFNVAVGKECAITATLTGYAYETVAGQPIVAGQTSGGADDDLAAREEATAGSVTAVVDGERSKETSGSLGKLALGTDGVIGGRP